MRHNFQRAMCTGMLWLCGAMVAPSLVVAADSSATQAQAGTSSVKQNSKSVSEVLKYIETHSDYMFVYAEGANRQLDKRINIMSTPYSPICVRRQNSIIAFSDAR